MVLKGLLKPGDIYEAWLYAYRNRLARHHQEETLPQPKTWNELTGIETETYQDMAEQLNRQLAAGEGETSEHRNHAQSTPIA